MLVYQRVNLHFPMVFPWFSHGFPMVFMAALSRHPVLRARHHRHGKAHQSEPRRKQGAATGICGEQTEKKQTFIIIYIYIYTDIYKYIYSTFIISICIYIYMFIICIYIYINLVVFQRGWLTGSGRFWTLNGFEVKFPTGFTWSSITNSQSLALLTAS